MTMQGRGRRSRSGATGRGILTGALVVTPIAMVVFLFNRDHIGNPAWHPHARFHAAQLAGVGIATGALGLWLQRRPETDPRSGLVAAAVIAAAPPLGEFAALLVPGTSPIPDENRPNTIRILGVDVPGNLVAFAGMLAVIGAGLTLALRATRLPEKPESHG